MMRRAYLLLALLALAPPAVAPEEGRAEAPAVRPVTLDLKRERDREFAELATQIQQRAWYDSVAAQTHRREALILEGDRDPVDVVLRRTAALLAHIRELPQAPDLSEAAAKLGALRERGKRATVEDTEARKALFHEACALRRRIAFANPLLRFDRILFIKRERSRYNHMCDQFYGHNAVPGGGVLVLENAFGEKPAVRDVLAGSRVENGRLKGRSLAGGSFLSPDLSFDGRTLLFAHTEAVSSAALWSPERCYHVYKVGVDGSGLRQLTDGPWNEFDPCWLPDGRIAFVSERRGGYTRCSGGRYTPVYTLHRVDADGGDLTRLSFHETHEWQPSVGHDGMILYTRWDYVDRDTNVAHHPWQTTPDGCDPRAIHGNYPRDRGARPWMEMDIRAIPGSRKLISAAGAHHGQAYGSLVLIDPAQEDDGEMGPVRRLTPDAPFPEAENGKKDKRSCEQYATPWPLSEDVWLCVYDPGARRYGVYLADSFGNRELLYGDGQAATLSPIPVAPRPKPPVVAPLTTPGAESATVVLANVYHSRLAWPEGTKIRELRILQLVPKTTPNADQPRIGIARQANARAVLGTVPVEADGSACFTAPVGKPIYFQALDERGMAVQSMRSATYLQPGQRLSCLGCHEPRHTTPAPAADLMALKRAPSEIRPEPFGSNPFSYPLLVQGVLDRHCAGCHAKDPKSPSLAGGGKEWFPSYKSLAPYAFYFNSTNGSIKNRGAQGGARTIPGQFGARASKLLRYLGPEHHGVNLPEEDFRRITLWLDCNADFYGAYEHTEAQSLGFLIRPVLE